MSGALLNSDHHVLNHWIFSLLRNPVTNKKHYRLYVINKIPQIRVLDFQKVKLKVSARSLLCQFKNEVMWVTSLQWNRIEGLGNLFIWHNYRDMRLQSWWRVYIHLHRTCIMAVLSSTDFYISFFCDRMSGTHTTLSQKVVSKCERRLLTKTSYVVLDSGYGYIIMLFYCYTLPTFVKAPVLSLQ